MFRLGDIFFLLGQPSPIPPGEGREPAFVWCHVLKYRWKGLILEYQAYGYGMAPGFALLPCEHWVIVIFGQYLFWPLVIKHNQTFGFMDVCEFIHVLAHTPPHACTDCCYFGLLFRSLEKRSRREGELIFHNVESAWEGHFCSSKCTSYCELICKGANLEKKKNTMVIREAFWRRFWGLQQGQFLSSKGCVCCLNTFTAILQNSVCG